MIRHVILGLLRTGARMHGYALVQAYRQRSGAEISSGNFYRELQRLIRDGLVRSTANPSDADARRTPYEITPRGAAAFDEWLAARHVAGRSILADDLAARALFLLDLEPAALEKLLAQLTENLLLCSKQLERDRRHLLAGARNDTLGSHVAILGLLHDRRLKYVAADLEIIEAVRDEQARRVRPQRREPKPQATLAAAPRTKPARKRAPPITAASARRP